MCLTQFIFNIHQTLFSHIPTILDRQGITVYLNKKSSNHVPMLNSPGLLTHPAAMFMEHWKRRQMRLNYEWDLTGFEDEEVSGSAAAAAAAADNTENV